MLELEPKVTQNKIGYDKLPKIKDYLTKNEHQSNTKK
jgi:hypothetical protein